MSENSTTKIYIRRLDGVFDTVDESTLLKREYVSQDDEDMRIDVVEYCMLGCPGTHEEKVMCPLHVHRSARGTIKRWPHGMEGSVRSFE